MDSSSTVPVLVVVKGGAYSSEGFSGGDFSDFFESIFGGGFQQGGASPFQQGQRQQQRRGADAQLKLDISLEEAFHGGAKTIQFAKTQGSTEMKKLKINIPSGVKTGQKIRLAGQGQASPYGGDPGDLFLEMNILPHRLFRLEDRDVILRLPLTPWEAAARHQSESSDPVGFGRAQDQIRHAIRTKNASQG